MKMSTLRLSAALVLAAPAAYAQKGSGSDGIVLHVYSTNRGDGEDPMVEANARITNAVNKSPGRRLVRAQTSEDFARELQKLKTEGVRVRKLVIEGHGAPGFMGAVDSGSLASLKGMDEVFAPGAEIVFHSCSIAQGPEGVRFIRDMSKTLLARNGGTIVAPVWYYLWFRSEARPFMGQAAGQLGGSPLGYMEARVAPGGEVRLLYTQPGVHEVREAAGDGVDRVENLMAAAHKGEKSLVRGFVETAADVAQFQELGLRAATGLPLGPGVTRDAEGFIVRSAEGVLEARQKLERSALKAGRSGLETVIEADRSVRQFVQDQGVQAVRIGVELEKKARPVVRRALPLISPAGALLNSLFDGK